MTENFDYLQAFKDKAFEILPEGSTLALYGSRARGDYRPDSDWDLLILINGPDKLPEALWNQYAWPFMEIGLEHDNDVSPRLYSYSGWALRHFFPFYKNVEKDKILLFQN